MGVTLWIAKLSLVEMAQTLDAVCKEYDPMISCEVAELHTKIWVLLRMPKELWSSKTMDALSARLRSFDYVERIGIDIASHDP